MASDTDLTDNGSGGTEAAPKRPSATRVEHFTPDERAARGKATRAEVPRTSHGEWEPALHRPDPVELLEEQAQTRVPELVPIRYGRMLVSPFTFYRGAAYLMASDLAAGPRTGLHTQLCGDAHLSNFGGFAAPDRKLVFSLNDFDRRFPARSSGTSSASLRASRSPGATVASTRSSAPRSTRRSAGHTARASARSPPCATSTSGTHESTSTICSCAFGPRLSARTPRPRSGSRQTSPRGTKDSMKALSKLTEVVDGELRIVGDPPLIVPIEDAFPEHVEQIEEFLRGIVRSYRRTLAVIAASCSNGSATCMRLARW